MPLAFVAVHGALKWKNEKEYLLFSIDFRLHNYVQQKFIKNGPKRKGKKQLKSEVVSFCKNK